MCMCMCICICVCMYCVVFVKVCVIVPVHVSACKYPYISLFCDHYFSLLRGLETLYPTC